MKRSSVVERELRSNNQSMDIDLESVPNQIGTAVLSTVDGKKKRVMSALFGVKCIEEDEDEEDELDAM